MHRACVQTFRIPMKRLVPVSRPCSSLAAAWFYRVETIPLPVPPVPRPPAIGRYCIGVSGQEVGWRMWGFDRSSETKDEVCGDMPNPIGTISPHQSKRFLFFARH